MKTLPTLIQELWELSKRAYGLQRPPEMAYHHLMSTTRTVHDNAQSLYGWVDVILAGIEGGLRSGATPYALSQAIINRQAELGARKLPPALPHVPPEFNVDADRR